MNSLQRDLFSNDNLFKLLKDLKEKSTSKSQYVLEQKKYYEGYLKEEITGQKKTNCNIIRPIVETKTTAVLDAQFITEIVPDISSFYDIEEIKQARDIASILNDCVKDVHKKNNLDKIAEKVARMGRLVGFGACQTTFDKSSNLAGEIKINYIEPESLFWLDNVMIGYEEELSPFEAKNKYARDNNGAFMQDLCKEIDAIADIEIGKEYRQQTNEVINYVNESNNTGGRAFVEAGSKGIQAGKKVKLLVMYLLDDSVYAPEEKDSQEMAGDKEEYQRAFPYGRLVVFSPNEKKKLILRDEPLEQCFKSLGNIDIFNAINYDKRKESISDIDDLTTIQDRINGAFVKYRSKFQNDFDTMLVDDDFGVEDNALVNAPITRVRDFQKYAKVPEVISNNGIEKAGHVLEVINTHKQNAMQAARVNETMLWGQRQQGTTSGDQVEALQESPMAEIRQVQGNLKDWLVSVYDKVLNFIMLYYSESRMLELTTGIDNAKFAKIGVNEQQERTIELYDEALQSIKTLKFDKNWKYKVSVVAGTEIPRSRKEQANLSDKIIQSGILNVKDIDLIELYMQMNDIPQGKAIVNLMRKKQKQASENPQKPIDVLSANPELMKAAATFIKAVGDSGFSEAVGQILQKLDLSNRTNDLTNVPVDKITAKSQAEDIAKIVPQQISSNPEQIIFGHHQANEIEDRRNTQKQKQSEVMFNEI